ncbi:small integral membrane protein 30 [Pleuronectes platessa]|uniref:small integral membrane protein 30 n=1 Tax=Pleuronectes platessa TaxID=8262 RepID=UPI00232A1806|nr:small integral membrane protein 30 [Pleuronectes platessa]
MDSRLRLPNAAAVIFLLVLALIPPAEAYDAGDALALLVCSVLAVVGCCAGLGWYARRRNGQL